MTGNATTMRGAVQTDPFVIGTTNIKSLQLIIIKGDAFSDAATCM